MKNFFLICVSSVLICGSAFGQSDGYTMLSDSNGVALSGFYFPASNIVGTVTSQLPTNVVYTATLLTISNTVATNAAAQLQLVSNTVASLSANLVGNTNQNKGIYSAIVGGSTNLNFGTGSVILGGNANTIQTNASPSTYDVIAGGFLNLIATPSYHSGIFAGASNRLDGADRSAILGGWKNWISGGTFSLIAGGTGNLISGGTNNSVIGGDYNTVWSYGASYSTVIGGTNNTLKGNFNTVLGNNVTVNYNNVFVWSDGRTNAIAPAANNQFLVFASGGVGINTNSPGTNALAVSGNADFASASIGGTNLFTLFSPTITSNGLSTLFNYNLTGASNALAAFATGTSNNVVTSSNALRTLTLTASNSLQLFIAGVSNTAAGVSLSKAFTATLPATYASIGIGFSTPLMPDGNYSVSLTPQDSTTADAWHYGMHWYVGSKNNSGFTIYVPFATNAYNLNFDCLVKENTQ